MKKGDIVLIPFPFSDLSGTKTRPALILIRSASDITVSFVTTQLKWKEEFDVLIEPSPSNGIKKPSLIRLAKIATIDRNLAIGKLGSLSQQELAEIDINLLKAFQLSN